jgi:hypothetical protein
MCRLTKKSLTGVTSGAGTAYPSGAPELGHQNPYIEEEQTKQWPK